MIAQERYEALVDALGEAYHHAQELYDNVSDEVWVERRDNGDVLSAADANAVRTLLWEAGGRLGAEKAVLTRARQT